MDVRVMAERALWNYHDNVKKVKELRLLLNLLMSVHGQNYSAAHAVNGVSDPVGDVVHKVLALERKIAGTEKAIQAVDSLAASLILNVKELNIWQMLGILECRYMEHKNPYKVMRELGITKGTYYRRNNELIGRAEEYLS